MSTGSAASTIIISAQRAPVQDRGLHGCVMKNRLRWRGEARQKHGKRRCSTAHCASFLGKNIFTNRVTPEPVPVNKISRQSDAEPSDSSSVHTSPLHLKERLLCQWRQLGLRSVAAGGASRGAWRLGRFTHLRRKRLQERDLAREFSRRFRGVPGSARDIHSRRS
jgi:hypothetical protein